VGLGGTEMKKIKKVLVADRLYPKRGGFASQLNA